LENPQYRITEAGDGTLNEYLYENGRRFYLYESHRRWKDEPSYICRTGGIDPAIGKRVTARG